MSSELRALIKKEWQQQQKFFWVTLILLFAVMITIAPFSDEFATVLVPLGMTVAAIVVAANVIASEHATHTHNFWANLPLCRRKKTIVKFSIGFLASITPFLLIDFVYATGLLVIQQLGYLPAEFIWRITHEFPGDLHFVTAILVCAFTGCWTAILFYLWIAVLALRQSSLLRAGAISLGFLLFCICYLEVSSETIWLISQYYPIPHGERELWNLWFNLFNPLLPGLLTASVDHADDWPRLATILFFIAAAIVQIGIPVLLARWLLNEYGKTPTEITLGPLSRVVGRIRRWWVNRQATKRERSPVPLTVEPTSIFRELLRQTWRTHKWVYCLMTVCGFLCGPAIGLLAVGVNFYFESKYGRNIHDIADEMESWMMMLILCVGLPSMVYLGTTTLLNDRSQEIQSFWRSLPISPGRFIATRFFVAFAIGIACLFGPAIVILPALKIYSLEFSSLELSYLPIAVSFRGLCYLFAHYVLAAALLWAIGNPVQSIVGILGYSAIVHSLITSLIPRFREPFAVDQLLLDPNPAIANACYLLVVLLALPSIVLLSREMLRQQLTAT